MRTLVLLLLLLTLGSSAGAVQDQTSVPAVCPICGRLLNDQTDYATKASHTLLRGATNTLFGWTEVILQPAETAKQSGNLFTGLAKGVGQGLTRTLTGVAEVVTFWTPKVNKRYLRFSDNCPICMGNATSAKKP